MLSTIHDGLIDRLANIRWSAGVDCAQADQLACSSVVINEPAKSVWSKLPADAAWSTWYSNASGRKTRTNEPRPHRGRRHAW
jgi:hypothetical protein